MNLHATSGAYPKRLVSNISLLCRAQHPQHTYVVAQVDCMKDVLQGIRYTPTFAVYRKGRRIDQFFGSSPQQLRDRVWLHSEDPDCSAS